MRPFILLALAICMLPGCGKPADPAVSSGSTTSGDSTTRSAPTTTGGPPKGAPERGSTAAPADEKVGTTDIKVGIGDAVKPGDTVTVLYKGQLKNGTVFDSTDGKPPYVFTIGGGTVIKGWDLGVAGMKVGGERKLHVPASLGYGANPNGDIPANSDLEFDIKLLGVVRSGEDLVVDTKTIKAGTGTRVVKEGDNVSLNYEGSLLNGTVFDSSAKHNNTTLDFQVGGGTVVSGLEKGVEGMKVGETRLVTVPPAAGYGGVPPEGSGIPPNSTLVFKVTLVKFR